MQKKSIEKNISTKLEEWLNTITDLELRNKIKANALVSGGSIVSLLLNEPVNDYDVYIKDIKVLKELAEYYTHNIDGVKVLDGREKVRLVEELEAMYDNNVEAKEIFNAYAISLRNLKEDQIKLYFESNNGGIRLNEEKSEAELNYHPVFMSPNAISLSQQIQIVLRFHGDNEAIHKTFDFVHATNYFTFKDGVVLNLDAVTSILTKQLKYQGSLYPLTSIIRMKKFIKRGWNINAGEMLKIMFQISELNLKDPNVLEEQLIGVDVAYFSLLIDILRGVESEKMTSAYLNAIIDKVFGE